MSNDPKKPAASGDESIGKVFLGVAGSILSMALNNGQMPSSKPTPEQERAEDREKAMTDPLPNVVHKFEAMLYWLDGFAKRATQFGVTNAAMQRVASAIRESGRARLPATSLVGREKNDRNLVIAHVMGEIVESFERGDGIPVPAIVAGVDECWRLFGNGELETQRRNRRLFAEELPEALKTEDGAVDWGTRFTRFAATTALPVDFASVSEKILAAGYGIVDKMSWTDSKEPSELAHRILGTVAYKASLGLPANEKYVDAMAVSYEAVSALREAKKAREAGVEAAASARAELLARLSDAVRNEDALPEWLRDYAVAAEDQAKVSKEFPRIAKALEAVGYDIKDEVDPGDDADAEILARHAAGSFLAAVRGGKQPSVSLHTAIAERHRDTVERAREHSSGM
jgi:hypothetical protein